MSDWLVAAALLSALLHAGWNAAVKANARPTEAMTAQMLASGLLVLPGLWWTGWPQAPAWPWLAASTLLNVAAVAALLRAYELGGFGVVYPMARASSVLLVVPLAVAFAGEWPRPWGLAGVVLVSSGVALLALARPGATAISKPALGWTLAAGVAIAGYVVCDAQGARRAGSPLPYGFALMVGNALGISILRWRQGSPLNALAAQWKLGLSVAVASVTSYLLILWVWMHAPIAIGAALRDTSAVFATLIAAVVLKERITARGLLAVALAFGGALLLRLG
jgi:drug/metabolite transporter (DMT)-like permease